MRKAWAVRPCLVGSPSIRQLPVTEVDAQAYLAKVKTAGSSEEALRSFLARYRAARGRE
jgi:hypothetical protein